MQIRVSLTKKEIYEINQKIDGYKKQHNINNLFKLLNIHDEAKQQIMNIKTKRRCIIQIENYFDLYKISTFFSIQQIRTQILEELTYLYKRLSNDTETDYFNDFLESGNFIKYFSRKLNKIIKKKSFQDLPLLIATRILAECHRKNIQADPLYNFIMQNVDDRFYLLRFLNFPTFSEHKIHVNDFKQIIVSLFHNYDELVGGLIELVDDKKIIFNFLKAKLSNPIASSYYSMMKQQMGSPDLVWGDSQFSKVKIDDGYDESFDTKNEKSGQKVKVKGEIGNNAYDDFDDGRNTSKAYSKRSKKAKGKPPLSNQDGIEYDDDKELNNKFSKTQKKVKVREMSRINNQDDIEYDDDRELNNKLSKTQKNVKVREMSRINNQDDIEYDDDRDLNNKFSKTQKKVKVREMSRIGSHDKSSKHDDADDKENVEQRKEQSIQYDALLSRYEASHFRPLSEEDKERAEVWKKTEKILKKGRYRLHQVTYNIGDDINKSIRGTVTISPDDELHFPPADKSTKLKRKKIYEKVEVVNESTFEAARRFKNSHKDDRLCVLNFASAVRPGGGVLNGRQAQEETLSRMSSLYLTLLKDDTMYAYNRQQNSPYFSDYMIFSPDVVVFRDDDYRLIESYKVSVISAPAVNCSDLKKMKKYNEKKVNNVMYNRCRRILDVCLSNGIKNIVLGAFGCGVFGNKPENVSQIFKELIVDEGYGCFFDKIIFAIIAAKGKGCTLSQFKEAFGKY